jgi:16S rRNA (uracil1498-N3)-methyltransferase
MIRVLVPTGTLTVAAAVPLEDEEQHHLRVRRVHAGDNVLAFDGAGGIGRGVLEAAGRGFEVVVHEVETIPPPDPLLLAVATGDRDRWLRLAEQCTELGVTRLMPLVTERALSVESRLREPALDKVRRRARDACKQSGNPWAPVVHPFADLAAFARAAPAARWLLAAPHGLPLPLEDPLRDACGWLIGPEGGFTAGEADLLVTELAARSTWLAPHVLRFETAAIAAASLTIGRRGRRGG